MCWRAEAARGLLFGLAAALGAASALADGGIETDGSIGPKASLSFDGPGVVTIGGRLGRRPEGGPNLFHSFSRFEIPAGEEARFAPPAGVTRIIARVTGEAGARIDGDLGAFPPVDLWMFSPGGIAIGPEGRIRTGGALHLSTADRLEFADGARLAADPSAGAALTTAAPEAFGFVGARPGRITVGGAGARLEAQCNLFTAACGTLSLSAGSVTLDRAAVVSDFGQSIRIAGAGAGERVAVEGPLDAAGGFVAIRGEGARVTATRGGFVEIAAGSVAIEDGAQVAADRGARRDAAGGVTIRGGEIVIADGAAVRTRAFGDGDAGDIRIEGFRRLTIRGERSSGAAPRETAVESEALAAPAGQTPVRGSAGAVAIRGGRVEVLDAGRVFSNTSGAGDAGGVSMRVVELAAAGGSQIGSGALDAPGGQPATGRGGRVEIIAGESVALSGESAFANPVSGRPEPSGLFTSTEGRTAGAAGDVTVRTPRLTLSDGAEIASETANASDAGAVTVEADRLSVGGGAEITTRALDLFGPPTGAAGAIALEGGALVMEGDRARGADGVAEIASDARLGLGAAGSVSLDFREIRIGPAARVTTDGGVDGVPGGAIALAGERFALLDGGVVTTSVALGDGDGGAIGVSGGALVLRDGSTLQATADRGVGGLVAVRSDLVFLDETSTFDVDSNSGADGTVVITGVLGPDQAVEVEALPDDFLDLFALVDDGCVGAVSGGSAFVSLGRGGAPFTGGSAPALFGAALPYPAGAGGAADAGAAAPAAPCPAR